ncbi:MAG: prepilin-type N-terminal cleavage/methylation domain-containing protein [Candidatus Carbobacillus altaicus]|nr:prepilin-type N-terminal cleavage/methylation domain-containing protein [Candidatus Carbobacillus altaicus]
MENTAIVRVDEDRLRSALKKRNTAGFTLIELLAVVVILGIIALIAFPLIGGIIEKSKIDATKGTAISIGDAARLYIIGEKNGDFKNNQTVQLSELTGADPPYIQSDVKDGWGEDITSATATFGENGTLQSVTVVTEKNGTWTYTPANNTFEKQP